MPGQPRRRLRIPTATLSLSLLVAVGCGPHERTPGFRLFGEVVDEPVEDWSFTDAHGTIAVETRTGYGLPHSVTTVCVRHGDALYVPSRNPRGKRWVANVLRDPRVRLRIGERIYERRAVRVEDPSLSAALVEALSSKYERPAPGPQAPELWFFRMEPRA